MRSGRRAALLVLALAALTTVTGLWVNTPAAPGHSWSNGPAAGHPGRGGSPGDTASPTPSGPSASSQGWTTVSPTPVASTAPAPSEAPAPAGADRCPAPSGVLRAAPGSGRTVALTFDDGPGPDTPALLDVLRSRGVHATFFMIGRDASAHPDLVARVAAEGHLIGDHTWHHTYPEQLAGGWTTGYLRREMNRTNDVLTAAGHTPVCWFRPPGGNLPAAVVPAARSLGMTVVLWSVDPKDWQLQDRLAHDGTPIGPIGPVTDQIVQRVSAGLRQPHPLILMHDGGGFRAAGVAAVGRIIDQYRAAGYRFVRLDGV
jgi:peptidoglycan/xylan/chitin deacetylase (PgdA/CDA1 family)